MILLALLACRGEIEVTPTRIAWDEIDFMEPRPDLGYLPQQVTVENTGRRDLELVIAGFDADHLLLGAHLVDEDPPTLPALAPGSAHVLTVAVWAYLDGERDTRVEGSFRVTADGLGEDGVVEWSFVPVRNIPVDTGR